MSRTHVEIVEEAEIRLMAAICTFDMEELHEIIHPELVFTNETGQVFMGIGSLQINNPDVLRIRTIEVMEREIAIFNTVAVVNTIEKRTGEYLGIDFGTEFRVTRIWKFHTHDWMLIAASVVML